MKVNNLIEDIFAHAVALDQSGGLRNTIYAVGHQVFILNYDHTVLLRFLLRKSESAFSSPISFRANDYDSNVFFEEDGKIIFKVSQGEFIRTKTCATPDLSPEEVRKLFRTYPNLKGASVILSKDVLNLLDKSLSHIEFSGKRGEVLRITQRNIYSGSVIEIQKANSGLIKEVLTENVGPLAIKTNDFFALYSFQDTLKFSFSDRPGKEDYMVVTSVDQKKRDMQGVVACCLYDEIIQIREAKHGREKS